MSNTIGFPVFSKIHKLFSGLFRKPESYLGHYKVHYLSDGVDIDKIYIGDSQIKPDYLNSSAKFKFCNIDVISVVCSDGFITIHTNDSIDAFWDAIKTAMKDGGNQVYIK